jgi:maltose/moltooligosaccharide transporter
MDILNAFIVLPQIFVALGLGWIMKILLKSNCLLVVVAGGVSLLLAAVLVYFVYEAKTSEKTSIKVEI